jgi:hypothetical protein
MLVAMAITLVMMAAVVTLFANISASIRNRRAMIELGGQLRQVRQRLALDLAGATCDAKTWQRPGENRGYIEYLEGPYSDMMPSILVDGAPETSQNLELDYTTSLVPSGGDPTMILTAPLTTAAGSGSLMLQATPTGAVTNGRALGDWDDILSLTVRSESEPFVAQLAGNTIESALAEVVWYAEENPKDDPSTPADESNINGNRLEPGMRRIYRRAFLIAPWLGPWPINNADPFQNKPANISTHFAPANSTTNEPARWVANTLADLTKREYRAFRQIENLSAAVGAKNTYPYLFANSLLTADSQYLVLNDALAFDVRVYDPGAPLYQAAPGTVVQPGDPGWPSLAYTASQSNSPAIPAGFGAYCDLGWNWDLTRSTPQPYAGGIVPPANIAWLPANSPTPLFQFPHRAGWHPYLSNPPSLMGFPAVYDTWSFHYENNGRDEELLLEDQYSTLSIKPTFATTPFARTSVIDQGTNGLDDDNQNGVDDPGERETSPPYDVPLRGIQIKLRVYERDARQIRETSVTHSFVQ